MGKESETDKIRVGVIFGGRSGEHEVSLMSAASVIGAMDREKYEIITIGITRQGEWLLYDGSPERIEDGSWQEIAERQLLENPEAYSFTLFGTGGSSLKDRIDFALPILHGPYGEDGTIQGLFEIMDIPYGGCGVTGSAVCMDKGMAKSVFDQGRLPQAKYLVIRREEMDERFEEIKEDIRQTLGYPVFVKPANMGSSVGIGKVKEEGELKQALDLAAKYDRRIVIEEAINCREIETAVMGNRVLQISEIGEILPSSEYYDYKAKYFDGGATKLCVPANLTKEQRSKIREIALKAYDLVDCSGYARIDFFVDQDTGEIYINEINTIPGFTRYSMFPLLWQEAGISYPALIERIIELGYQKYRGKSL